MFQFIGEAVTLDQNENPQLQITWNWTRFEGEINFCCFRLNIGQLFRNKCYTLNEVERDFWRQIGITEIPTLENIRGIINNYRNSHLANTKFATKYPPDQGGFINGNEQTLSFGGDFRNSVILMYMYDNTFMESKIIPLWNETTVDFDLQVKEKRRFFGLLERKKYYLLTLNQNDDRIKIVEYNGGGVSYRVILPPSESREYYLPYDENLSRENIRISYFKFH